MPRTIAHIQFAPALGDLHDTLARLTPLLDRARDADLVVLPELCNSGYALADATAARRASEAVTNSRFLEVLRHRARENRQYIVTGFNEQDGERLYNSAVLVGPQGVAGVYRKLHLFLDEQDIFTPGDLGLPIFDLGWAQVGLLVCFDWAFPEAWRSLAVRGADIIAHPSNLVLPGLAQQAAVVHAITNRVFVATANRTGSEGGLTFTGLSQIVSPRGDVLARSPQTGDDVAIADIDPAVARDKAITARNDLLSDRRLDVYPDLGLPFEPPEPVA